MKRLSVCPCWMETLTCYEIKLVLAQSKNNILCRNCPKALVKAYTFQIHYNGIVSNKTIIKFSGDTNIGQRLDGTEIQVV